MARLAVLIPVALAIGCPSPTPNDAGVDAGVDAGGADAGGNPQTEYAFAGCDAGSGGCPNDVTFYCALNSILAKYRACADAGDCVRPTVSNCVAWGDCQPVAVNAASLSAFETEAGLEVTRYCAGALCHEAGDCAVSFSLGRVACIQNLCVGIQDDAGM